MFGYKDKSYRLVPLLSSVNQLITGKWWSQNSKTVLANYKAFDYVFASDSDNFWSGGMTYFDSTGQGFANPYNVPINSRIDGPDVLGEFIEIKMPFRA